VRGGLAIAIVAKHSRVQAIGTIEVWRAAIDLSEGSSAAAARRRISV
jgi:hypothetical protein